jgi:molybdopterin converting factor small subunit
MIVRVRLLGEFRKHLLGRPEPLAFELAEASTVADLAATIGISADAEVVVGVNGQLGGAGTSLADGDEIVFVSPMSGGFGWRARL